MLSTDNIMLSLLKMKTKLKMIGIVNQYPQGIHLRELSRLLHTGMPNIVRYSNILQKEDIIKKEKDANLVKLKLKKSPRTVAYLKLINTEKFLQLPKNIQIAIKDFLDLLIVKPLIVILFGSFAKGIFTKDSDIDILLIFQNVENSKDIENTANRISMRTNTKINPIYLNYKNFEMNFLNKEHDFSAEIRQDVIIMYGIELYYDLLWRFLK